MGTARRWCGPQSISVYGIYTLCSAHAEEVPVTAEVLAFTALFSLYAVTTHWAFRCQRVGRGLLQLAGGTMAYPNLFRDIMPTRFVQCVWLSRLLWVGASVLAWRLWGWYGLIPVVVYGATGGVLIDIVSPWPPYERLLLTVRQRITTLGALPAVLLLHIVDQVHEQLRAGREFEEIVWSRLIAPITGRGTSDASVPGQAAPSSESN